MVDADDTLHPDARLTDRSSARHSKRISWDKRIVAKKMTYGMKSQRRHLPAEARRRADMAL